MQCIYILDLGTISRFSKCLRNQSPAFPEAARHQLLSPAPIPERTKHVSCGLQEGLTLQATRPHGPEIRQFCVPRPCEKDVLRLEVTKGKPKGMDSGQGTHKLASDETCGSDGHCAQSYHVRV